MIKKKKKTTSPVTFQRSDCDRIWITSHDAGPVLHFKKQHFTDTSWITDNDLKLTLRVIARYLGKDFLLIPLAEAPAILADPFGEKLPKMLEAGTSAEETPMVVMGPPEISSAMDMKTGAADDQ